MNSAPAVDSDRCRQRTARFRRIVPPLPGSVPRDNPRAMFVAARYEGQTLAQFLTAAHPHVSLQVWRERMASGSLAVDGRPVDTLDVQVRAGNKIVNLIRDDVEPDVAVDVVFLHEDESLIVLHKPAPLPMHPCGRFNRNSLVPLLAHVFGETFLPVHRLDADTTGLVVLAKSKAAARNLTLQFERREVNKVYIARVKGTAACDDFTCEAPLSPGPAAEGKRVVASPQDSFLAAVTRFRTLAARGSESVLAIWPSTGRTNQIRAHLRALGLPIVGDEAYGGDEAFISGRSSLCLHAWQLGFRHPDSGLRVQYQDDWPAFAADARSAVGSI